MSDTETAVSAEPLPLDPRIDENGHYRVGTCVLLTADVGALGAYFIASRYAGQTCIVQQVYDPIYGLRPGRVYNLRMLDGTAWYAPYYHLSLPPRSIFATRQYPNPHPVFNNTERRLIVATDAENAAQSRLPLGTICIVNDHKNIAAIAISEDNPALLYEITDDSCYVDSYYSIRRLSTGELLYVSRGEITPCIYVSSEVLKLKQNEEENMKVEDFMVPAEELERHFQESDFCDPKEGFWEIVYNYHSYGNVDGRAYDSIAAITNKYDLSFLKRYDYRIRPAMWRSRASYKQCSSDKKVVFADVKFWVDNSSIHNDHYVTVSETNPKLLAYYQNIDKARCDIRTPIKPGRYLKKYFSGILTEKQIAFYAAWQTTGAYPKPSDYSSLEVKYAYTPDEIEYVYENGPSSCMAGKGFWDGQCNPVRIYGAGDLAVAYLELPDTPNSQGNKAIVARVLCWPDRRIFGRVYPTPENYRDDAYDCEYAATLVQLTLYKKMLSAGYTPLNVDPKGFNGARLFRIPSMGTRSLTSKSHMVVMPYLDRFYGFSLHEDPQYLTMAANDVPSCQCANDTCGIAPIDDPSLPPIVVCDGCRAIEYEEKFTEVVNLFRASGRHDMATLCPACTQNSTTFCHGYKVMCYSPSITFTEIDGKTYSTVWLRRNNGHMSCLDLQWFIGNPVSMYNGDVWSEKQFAEQGFTCSVNGHNYPLSELNHNFLPEMRISLHCGKRAATRYAKAYIKHGGHPPKDGPAIYITLPKESNPVAENDTDVYAIRRVAEAATSLIGRYPDDASIPALILDEYGEFTLADAAD